MSNIIAQRLDEESCAARQTTDPSAALIAGIVSLLLLQELGVTLAQRRRCGHSD
jgi:hypothetical protein